MISQLVKKRYVYKKKCKNCDRFVYKYSKRGLCLSCGQKGQNNSNYNGRSERKNFCCDCGKEILLISIRCRSCSVKYEHLIRGYDWEGPNNGMWKGGHPFYYGPNWLEQRRLTRLRDDNICQICGITLEELGRCMDVHHLIPFRNFNYICGKNETYKDANDLNNLICLCHRCHITLEKREWRKRGR